MDRVRPFNFLDLPSSHPFLCTQGFLSLSTTPDLGMEAGQNSEGRPNPASQSQTSASGEKKKKTFINVHPCGKPFGELSEKFCTRAGELVRTQCPVSYKDWRRVPQNFRDDVWNALMLEFEFNVPSHLVKPHAEDTYSQRFRSGKKALRTKYLFGASEDEALAANPPGINPSTWKAFVRNEYEPDMIEKRAQNAENRKKSTIRHNLGRRSYLNKNYILEKKEGIVVEDRAGSWMKAHEMKGGGVHPTAVEKYEQLKAAKEKRKHMNEEGSTSNLDFDSDVLAEVFGPDNGKGYVRAYSSCMSKKRAQHGALASSLIEREVNKSNAPLEAKFDNLAKHVEECLKTMMQKLQVPAASQSIVGDVTPSHKTGSNSEHRTSIRDLNVVIEGEVREDMNSCSRVSENANVNLLNRDGVTVGAGYIVSGKDGEMCHGRKVHSTERKVRIELVNDINAPVPDPPQGDGHFTLGGFSEGGWLIWLESRLQPRN